MTDCLLSSNMAAIEIVNIEVRWSIKTFVIHYLFIYFFFSSSYLFVIIYNHIYIYTHNY